MDLEVVAEIFASRKIDRAANGSGRVQRILNRFGVRRFSIALRAEVDHVENGRTPCACLAPRRRRIRYGESGDAQNTRTHEEIAFIHVHGEKLPFHKPEGQTVKGAIEELAMTMKRCASVCRERLPIAQETL